LLLAKSYKYLALIHNISICYIYNSSDSLHYLLLFCWLIIINYLTIKFIVPYYRLVISDKLIVHIYIYDYIELLIYISLLSKNFSLDNFFFEYISIKTIVKNKTWEFWKVILY
jgi:hypothetical protein